MKSVSNQAEARPFFDRIQALRALGAVAVAGWHYSGWQLHGVQLLPHAPWAEAGVMENVAGRVTLALFTGHGALMMFFVVSGYVLRLALQYGPQEAGPAAKRFFVHRLFRIYPIVIVATLLHLWVAQYYPAISRENGPIDFWFVFKNVALLDVSIHPQLWALQLELLIAPVIFLLYYGERRFGTRFLAGVALLTTGLSFTSRWALWPPLSEHCFAFVIGMLIPAMGRALVSGASPGRTRSLLALSLLFLFASEPIFGLYSQVSTILQAVGSAILIALTVTRTDLAGLDLLDWPLLQKLGFATGSYYVLHMATFPFANILFARVIPPAWSVAYPALVGPLVLVGWLLAIAPVMWMFYRAIEEPGIALGRRLAPSPHRRPRVMQPGPP